MKNLILVIVLSISIGAHAQSILEPLSREQIKERTDDFVSSRIQEKKKEKLFQYFLNHLGKKYSRKKVLKSEELDCYYYKLDDVYAEMLCNEGKIIYISLTALCTTGQMYYQYMNDRYLIDMKDPGQIKKMPELVSYTNCRWFSKVCRQEFDHQSRVQIGLVYLKRLGYQEVCYIDTPDYNYRLNEKYGNSAGSLRYHFARTRNGIFYDRVQMEINPVIGKVDSVALNFTDTSASDIDQLKWNANIVEYEKKAMKVAFDYYRKNGYEMTKDSLWVDSSKTQRWYEDFNRILGYDHQVGNILDDKNIDYIPYYLFRVYCKAKYYLSGNYGYMEVGIDARNGELVCYSQDHGNIDGISYGYDLNQLRKKNGLPPCVDENFVPIKSEYKKIEEHSKRFYKILNEEPEKKEPVKVEK